MDPKLIQLDSLFVTVRHYKHERRGFVDTPVISYVGLF